MRHPSLELYGNERRNTLSSSEDHQNRAVPESEEPAVEGHSFDDLARMMADGTISRSRALKLVGATLLGAMLSSLSPGVAEARRKKKKKKKKKAACGPNSATNPCTNGCCAFNGSCQPGTSSSACGTGGKACQTCSGATPACVNQTCTQNPPGPPPPPPGPPPPPPPPGVCPGGNGTICGTGPNANNCKCRANTENQVACTQVTAGSDVACPNSAFCGLNNGVVQSCVFIAANNSRCRQICT